MLTNKEAQIAVGDVLISDLGNYHYIVEEISGNFVQLLWIERVNEPIPFSAYRRQRKLDGILSYYQHIPAKNVNWSNYKNKEKYR